MPEQRLEPTTLGHHVGIEERHEIRLARRKAGVTRGRGAVAAGVPQHLHVAVHTGEVGRLHRDRRAVVDHDHAQPAQRRHQAVQAGCVVPYGDNHCDVQMGRPAGRPRMRDGRVQEGSRELRGHRVVNLEAAPAEHVLGRRRQPQQAGR